MSQYYGIYKYLLLEHLCKTYDILEKIFNTFFTRKYIPIIIKIEKKFQVLKKPAFLKLYTLNIK